MAISLGAPPHAGDAYNAVRDESDEVVVRSRIAVAGAGVIGRRHIELVCASDVAELVAIADPARHAAELARSLGVGWYPNLDPLLEAMNPDGVIVATPNASHVADGLACIARRVPALIEKPIADTLDGARRLVAAAERDGVPILVGHHRRHSPLLAAAKAIVDDGVLGRLVAVTGSATFRKPDRYFTQAPWRSESGGGPILINLIHDVDDLRMLCGDIVEVQALASSAARGFAVEDTAAIVMRFAGGALATFMLSDAAASLRSWEQASGENPIYAHCGDEDCYVLAGTRGSLGVPTMRLRTYDGEPSWTAPFQTRIVEVQRADPLDLQLAHFCAVLRGEASPRVSGRDALETLRVTLAIARAAATAARIAIADT
jgi:predicted dehydrogenase